MTPQPPYNTAEAKRNGTTKKTRAYFTTGSPPLKDRPSLATFGESFAESEIIDGDLVASAPSPLYLQKITVTIKQNMMVQRIRSVGELTLKTGRFRPVIGKEPKFIPMW